NAPASGSQLSGGRRAVGNRLPRSGGLRALPKARSLRWSDLRWEGYESYARADRPKGGWRALSRHGPTARPPTATMAGCLILRKIIGRGTGCSLHGSEASWLGSP